MNYHKSVSNKIILYSFFGILVIGLVALYFYSLHEPSGFCGGSFSFMCLEGLGTLLYGGIFASFLLIFLTAFGFSYFLHKTETKTPVVDSRTQFRQRWKFITFAVFLLIIAIYYLSLWLI